MIVHLRPHSSPWLYDRTQPPNKTYICLSAFFAGRSFHSKQHVNESSWWVQVSGIPLSANKAQTDHCCTRLLQMKNHRERARNWTYLWSEILSEQKPKYKLCGSRKLAELPGAPLSASDTHQVPPCSSLACAFGCYQRTLALYQDSFYIICYHYIASNQDSYYCCFHLAKFDSHPLPGETQFTSRKYFPDPKSEFSPFANAISISSQMFGDSNASPTYVIFWLNWLALCSIYLPCLSTHPIAPSSDHNIW